MSGAKLYAIFHLNLAFSSVELRHHSKIVECCYTPLLEMSERYGIPIGLELTAWTLERIEAVDSRWITKLKTLIDSGLCEILASGDSQTIGPLIPYEINMRNLHLGMQAYRKIIGVEPKLAYVNEQAVSSGLLDVYIDAGFEGVVMEWDNARSVNPEWTNDILHKPVKAISSSGNSIPLIWNWSIAFQKLQRLAHGFLCKEDYDQFVHQKIEQGFLAFPVYGNDAEVFNFRPGRFNEETKIRSNEWEIVFQSFSELAKKYDWVLPVGLIERSNSGSELIKLTTPESPVIVKKQRKYNLTRWAVSGRNDLYLNTLCHSHFSDLKTSSCTSDEEWKGLCRFWSSDFRTHITENRYKEVIRSFEEASIKPVALSSHEDFYDFDINSLSAFSWDPVRYFLTYTCDSYSLTLNMQRGAAIVSLSFGDKPIIGTLDHGYFDNIELGADFYSNHCVIELPTERRRIADLSPCQWLVKRSSDEFLIEAEILTDLGRIRKSYRLKSNHVVVRYSFPSWVRPEGYMRLGWITLLNTDGDPPFVMAKHGGKHYEMGQIFNSVDHTQSASTLVSANNCLGCTSGEVAFGHKGHGVLLRWNPASCSPAVMLSNKQVHGERMSRLCFSLVEMDESLKAGGDLIPFEFAIHQWV